MKQKHASIPIFVPHLACPNQCVFCDQKRISGSLIPPKDPYTLLKKAAEKLSPKFTSVDIAFFGGSFTGIPKKEMALYLSAAQKIREEYSQITGIRLSTRPDYISEEVLSFLLSYGVTAVELGVQSFDDRVLSLSGRGHTVKDTLRAIALLREYPFETVLQLMPGLPGDTKETMLKTADFAVKENPDGVRIYPCVVLRDTPLAVMYREGLFTPLSVEEAVEISADMTLLFRRHGIRILRTGLHSSDLSENDGVLAGPFHPAFGELVEQRLYLREIESALDRCPPSGEKGTAFVAPGEISKAVGQKRQNLIRLKEKYKVDLSVRESADVRPGKIMIQF